MAVHCGGGYARLLLDVRPPLALAPEAAAAGQSVSLAVSWNLPGVLT